MDTKFCFISLFVVFIPATEQKTWLFAVDGNRRPFNFIDTDGYLKGADVDMIGEVFKIAGQKCEVLIQPFDECVRTYHGKFYPGRVHLNGAYANEQCMARIGLGRPKKIIVAATIDEAKALMLNQTGDALFSQRSSFNELDVIPKDFHCDINGSSMMVKKGSALPNWWNPAFEKYYNSGAYSTNCEGANKRYGGFPVIHSCLPRPAAISEAGVLGKR